MKSFLIIIFSLFVFTSLIQGSSAQYISSNSIMWGNYGFSATGVDMYGDTSYYGYSMGSSYSGSSSYDYQLEDYTSKFTPSGQSASQSKSELVYQPGFDLECDGTLFPVDEMVGEVTDLVYVESVEVVQGDPPFVTTCAITIHALDDSFRLTYHESYFESSSQADLNFPFVVISMIESRIVPDGVHENNNLGYNSVLISDESIGFPAYVQIFQKDRYVVTLISETRGDFNLLTPEQIVAASNTIRNRINPDVVVLERDDKPPIELEPCPLMQESEAKKILGVSKLQTRSGFLTAEEAESAGIEMPSLSSACYLNYVIPNLSNPSAEITYFLYLFDSQDVSDALFDSLSNESIEFSETRKIMEDGTGFVAYYNEGQAAQMVVQAGPILADARMVKVSDDSSKQGIKSASFEITDEKLIDMTFAPIRNLVSLVTADSPEFGTALTEPSEPKAPTMPTPKSSLDAIRVISVTPVDQQGRTVDSFSKGKPGFIKVTITADSPIDALITASLFDSDLTSLGVGSVKTKLMPGVSHEMLMSVYIPKDASIGDASIFVNTLSDWPAFNGIPLTEEFAAEVTIG